MAKLYRGNRYRVRYQLPGHIPHELIGTFTGTDFDGAMLFDLNPVSTLTRLFERDIQTAESTDQPHATPRPAR